MSQPPRLVLVRHGRTLWNADGRFQGQADVGLDDVGRAQAAAVAPVLAALRPTRLLSSDLTRAQDTAGPLAALTGLTVEPDKRWREIDVGAWSGLTLEQAKARYAVEHEAWESGGDGARGGGESYAEVGDRAADAAREAVAAVEGPGLIVVVTHGGTIRSTVAALLELPQEAWWRLGPLPNCAWSTLTFTSRGWRLTEHAASDPSVPRSAP